VGVVQQLLASHFEDIKQKVPVFTAVGITVVDGYKVGLNKVLWDSGALHSSYISQQWVDRHREALTDRVRNEETVVRLGDSKTKIILKEKVTLEVEAVSPVSSSVRKRARIDFCVMSMSGMDGIIGLPDILDHFLDIFIEILESGRYNRGDAADSLHLTELEDMEKRYTDLESPWKQELDEIPQEELETEDPCSFTGPLYYLSKPHDEVVQEYFAMFHEHISSDWRENKELLELLMSPDAVQVFVPAVWKGINGFEPVSFEFKEDMPKVHRSAARPVNMRVFQDAKVEFERMCTYMYVDSDSSIASPLVVAPKATKPFIRLCGDYRWVNQYVKTAQYYIPHVTKELERAAGYTYFIDLDLTNAFHQIVLSKETSEVLSVTTPWGLKRPVFLPEGVAPASGILQRMVMALFDDFSDWMVRLFDNVLVLCRSFDDGIAKLRKVIRRCKERGVVLKFAKSWIGFQQVTFFGYKVTPGQYELDEDRKATIRGAEMPKTRKSMQRFLGMAVFFNEFVPNFSDLTAKLYDMITPSFVWEKKTWTEDYERIFQSVKDALCASQAKHFPDYSLDWILRTDASDYAVANTLFQLRVEGDKTKYEVISFKAHKLTGAAKKWDIFKKEAFGVYFGVRSQSYYLRGKAFIIETDCRNLVWMEKSEVPIVIRWRVYMQSFQFLLRHIKGKDNVVADWASRMQEDDPDVKNTEHEQEMEVEGVAESNLSMLCLLGEAVDEEIAIVDPGGHVLQTAQDFLRQVHGGRMPHYGAKRTWQLLNKYFPGHRVPMRVVQDFVKECSRCQKDARQSVSDIQPAVRTLLPEGNRVRVGIDSVTVTPADKDGNVHAIVLVNHMTKHVSIYPAKSYDATTAATALFIYFCRFGGFDEVASDPGSMFLSDTVQKLNAWLGIRHKVSLVDVHTSNGVERTNGEILRHLRALCNDSRIRDEWSRPENLCLVEFMLNDRVSTETPYSAFELTFGSADLPYFRLPDVTGESVCDAWLKKLNESLRVLRQRTLEFQQELKRERERENVDAERVNQYQPGDFVLMDKLHDPCKFRSSKLDSRYAGPYEVLRHVGNCVEVRHVNMGFVTKFPVERLTIFVGSRDEALKLAMEDVNQFEVDEILAWRGDPSLRTTMEFEVKFKDGDIMWKPWDLDLSSCQPFEEYCRRNKELYLLLYTTDQVSRAAAAITSMAITDVQPGDTIFVDLRYFGTYVYDNLLDLPDKYHIKYVVRVIFTKWTGRTRKKLDAQVPLFRRTFEFNNLFVHYYAHQRTIEQGMVEITTDFLETYPDIRTMVV